MCIASCSLIASQKIVAEDSAEDRAQSVHWRSTAPCESETCESKSKLDRRSKDEAGLRASFHADCTKFSKLVVVGD